MRTITVLDTDLKSFGGSNYLYAEAIQGLCAAKGWGCRIIGNRDCEPDVLSRLAVQPVYPQLARPAWLELPVVASLVWLSIVSRHMHAALEAAALGPFRHGDVVCLPSTDLFRLGGVLRWYRRLPEPRPILAPFVFDSFTYIRHGKIRAGRIAVLYRYIFDRLRRVAGDRLRLISDNGIVARSYEGLTGIPVSVLPLPTLHVPESPARGDLFGLVHLGIARVDKGFLIAAQSVPEIIRRWPQSHFAFQCAPPSWEPLAPEIAAAVNHLAAYPTRVTLIRRPLPTEGYKRLLAASGLVLLPYLARAYHARGSGVASEAAELGKPMAVTGNTWMADRLQELGLGEFIMRDESAPALAEVLDRYLSDPGAWTLRFAEARNRWRDAHPAPSFESAFES